jgi:UDP-2-acetamido-2,6-beta-L-arabino-hexul-4-ose reductase
MKILVTGSQGFIAKNLIAHLQRMGEMEIKGLGRDSSLSDWEEALSQAEVIFHLAGVNRPPDPKSFQKDNNDLTKYIVDSLEKRGYPYQLLFSSSTQATQDNPYGTSKKDAEDYIHENVKYGSAIIYRLPGVFGKWSRPNYNSVVSTYCYNVANDQPLEIRDPDFQVRLIYIDDIMRSFVSHLHEKFHPGVTFEKIDPEFSISLGKLATMIQSFKENRKSLFLPRVGDIFEKALYSTWLTYLAPNDFSYGLELKKDNRGSLFELLKSETSGQLFVSTTLPGITRGNHFHHSKTEKFIVVQGAGLIQFRSVLGEQIIEYNVNGAQPQVVDIPPGYTHNITNTGDDIMITLFWANEVFDPQNPDTFFEQV